MLLITAQPHQTRGAHEIIIFIEILVEHTLLGIGRMDRLDAGPGYVEIVGIFRRRSTSSLPVATAAQTVIIVVVTVPVFVTRQPRAAATGDTANITGVESQRSSVLGLLDILGHVLIVDGTALRKSLSLAGRNLYRQPVNLLRSGRFRILRGGGTGVVQRSEGVGRCGDPHPTAAGGGMTVRIHHEIGQILLGIFLAAVIAAIAPHVVVVLVGSETLFGLRKRTNRGGERDPVELRRGRSIVIAVLIFLHNLVLINSLILDGWGGIHRRHVSSVLHAGLVWCSNKRWRRLNTN
mmetsp:Transcript_27653/g.64844  ORF Transcript_27653/g.64844 Transcript_27653/m.64844 type:complete len:293 (-) Transcript_27653:69-947(-)